MEFDPDSWPACWVLGILARTGSAAEFYHSAVWRRKTRQIRKAQHNRCWACLRKSPPVITTGRDKVLSVHHRFELRRRPDLALSDYGPNGEPNLVLLCDSCHWDMHHSRRPEITPERW